MSVHRFACLLLPLLLSSLLVGCRHAAPVVATGPDWIQDEHRELADHAAAVIDAVGDSPGREYANFLRTPPRSGWLKELATEQKVADGMLADRVSNLTSIVRHAEAGLDWPLPPVAKVPKVRRRVQIDGKLDDWGDALRYTGLYKFNSQVRCEAPATTWLLMWDEQYLYFAFDCVDTDLVAPVYERDGAVYSDDAVEFMLMPEARFRTYWEVIISPSHSIFDSVQCKKNEQWGLDGDTGQTIEGLKYAMNVRGTVNERDDEDQGYTVEIAVPWDQLPGYSRAKPAVGQQLKFILVRLDRDGEVFTPYAYQPLLAWGHNIWNHATMELVP